MKQKLISALQFFILLAFGLLLMWLVFRKQDLEKIFEEMKQANLFWIGLACTLSLVSNWFRALRWNMLIEPMGYKPKTSTLFLAVNICYLGNLALPRMGEVTRCAVMKKYEQIPLKNLIGTIIIERFLDLVCLALITVTGILLEFDLLKDFIYDKLYFPMQTVIAEKFSNSFTLFIVIAGISIVLLFIFILLFKKIKQTKIYFRINEILKGFAEGAKTLKKLENNGLFILYTILIWGCYWMMTYVGLSCLPFTSHLGLVTALSVTAMGGLGIVAPVPGGIGAYHWIVSQTLMLYSTQSNEISKADGLVWATVIHATQMLSIILFGFISLLLLPFFSKKNVEQV